MSDNLNTQKEVSNKPSVKLYDQSNYKFMLIGCGLMLLGYILMGGGAMKDPNTWDESIIYSPIRITLSPMVIIGGLCTIIYGIFKK
jgi:hypothetical protein